MRASPWHVRQRVSRIETAVVASGDCARTAQANTNPTHTDRMVHTNILHSTRSSDASQKRAIRLATKAVDSSKGNRTVIHQKQSDFDFGRTGFQADREGIAVYARPDGTGFVVCTDQIASNSLYRFYRR
jgi:hypothetical protein